MVHAIFDDGFSLPDADKTIFDLAVLSLRVSLRAYFSTYASVRRELPFLLENRGSDRDNHTVDYCEKYAEAILHYQHFIELTCKEYLRRRHPLLAAEPQDQVIILDRLLAGEPVSVEAQEKLKSIEFSETLKRINALITEHRMDPEVEFLLSARPVLEKLNGLRNRLWHRGTYILRYRALDRLYSQELLPLALKITGLPLFRGQEAIWRYTPISCGVDPISEIVEEGKLPHPDFEKLAILKEMARSGYENPLSYGRWSDHQNRDHLLPAAAAAEAAVRESGFKPAKQCPVCGTNSLVAYSDYDGDSEGGFIYIPNFKCFCCSFSMSNGMKNPRQCGLAIEDFWEAREV